MASEGKRGCGYRVVGGLYLVGGVLNAGCDRLPYLIEYCPTCGAGIKFSRAFQWLDPMAMFGIHDNESDMHGCKDAIRPCYMCDPDKFIELSPKYGLLWVGESSYSPLSFLQEARVMGISKRIPFIPKELKLGKTVVLLAHNNAIPQAHYESMEEAPQDFPGIFCAFIPSATEMPVWESDMTEENVEHLTKRGITPIPIKDGDLDHDPRAKQEVTMDPETGVFSVASVLEN